MQHPFDLEIIDLEAIQFNPDPVTEPLTDQAAETVAGGSATVTTQALGEEGGFAGIEFPGLPDVSTLFPISPPEVTTQALGEEGGEVTTLALGEEGGEFTTLALGEEGGGI